MYNRVVLYRKKIFAPPDYLYYTEKMTYEFFQIRKKYI